MVSVIAGANASLTKDDISKNEALFQDAAYCLLQSEIPLAAINTACEPAHEHRAKVIFKLSSDIYLPNELIAAIDIFVLNAQQLAIMESDEGTIQEKAQRQQQRGAQCIIVTQGENGCYLFDHQTQHHYDAAPLAAIDTTGAGDASVSALASYLLYGYKLPEATSVAILPPVSPRPEKVAFPR
ncbi:sugar/nucleoside kinase (ribokinase family) [Bifidobacterium commune]|uniref:PfkB family carbohydrate kinase n=1 Tax=Bifidobacterium commune TaxID=1505727 RepID=UPI0017D7FAE8|nr:PfkB family carbohydrate kinase [Bifidobacterium commune]MBB2955255.1 sugar/nucleoside kinase (ribokinase family) [Bifidobacterium commune]